MNERIKQLMLEADYAAPEIAKRAQVLAELIIRDIHKFVDDRDTAQILSRGILKMYGLEEQ
jgi:archaellum component FlaC